MFIFVILNIPKLFFKFFSGIGTPLPGLNIIVNDKDLGDNGRYVLAMRTRDSRVSNWFKIIPETALGRSTVLIRLVDNEGFDYDAGVTEVDFDIVAMYQDNISVSSIIFPEFFNSLHVLICILYRMHFRVGSKKLLRLMCK